MDGHIYGTDALKLVYECMILQNSFYVIIIVKWQLCYDSIFYWHNRGSLSVKKKGLECV